MTLTTRLVAVGALAAAGVLALVLSRGGGDEPARPAGPARVVAEPGDHLRVRAVPDSLDVIVGRPVRLRGEVARGASRRGALAWRWVAAAGSLDATDRPEVVWTAPGKPGRYAIGLAVEDGDGRARNEIRIEVRLPSPDEVAALDDLMRQLAARRRAATAELAALERRAEALRAEGARRDSIADRLRAQGALEELAGVLVELGRIEEARGVWDELLAGMLPADAKYRPFRAAYGDVAFFLGDEDAALAAWRDAGDHAQGLSLYYRAEVLERRGDREAAMDDYQRAQDGARWFADPVYRHALLALEGGATAGDVAALLVEASPRLDRDRMLERLDADPALAPLRRALDETGRLDDLEAARAIEIEADVPTN